MPGFKAVTMLSELDALPTIQLGNFTLQFELDELSAEGKETAMKELRETPEAMEQGIKELRALLKADSDLVVPLDNDLWLVRFLRVTKYYPESAHQLIRRYYEFKLKHNNIYDGLVPTKEQNVFKQDILTVLPYRDQFGRRMLVMELGKKWFPSKCTLDEVFKGAVIYMEAAMLEPQTQVSGAVVMFDMEGLSMNQVMQFTPPFAKRIVDWLQDAVPVRVKNIHVVNQPYIFNIVFALFKPFLREKLKKRIIFHGSDRKSLHKYISPKCLAPKYGGTVALPEVTGSQWLEVLIQCDKEFEAINSYGLKKK